VVLDHALQRADPSATTVLPLRAADAFREAAGS
jgi:hypothetical protein